MSLEAALQNLVWLTPWAPVGSKRAAELERTLSGLAAPHPLAGRACKAIGARSDSPDSLFLVRDPEQLCLVQLTKARGHDPAWPEHTFFESVDEFVEGCMQPDHLEDTDDDV